MRLFLQCLKYLNYTSYALVHSTERQDDVGLKPEASIGILVLYIWGGKYQRYKPFEYLTFLLLNITNITFALFSPLLLGSIIWAKSNWFHKAIEEIKRDVIYGVYTRHRWMDFTYIHTELKYLLNLKPFFLLMIYIYKHFTFSNTVKGCRREK